MSGNKLKIWLLLSHASNKKSSDFQIVGIDGNVLVDTNDPRIDDRFFKQGFEFTPNKFDANQYWSLDIVYVLSKSGYGYVTSKKHNSYTNRIKKVLTLSKSIITIKTIEGL